ncbi:uncharacterized protein LOC129953936 isoform X2 [Eupeodes corollae]|uniref:uncharacterized protein LOC129953936 isoform X2 n=1 Tax=Eupeodes corollae TaxID=290404 RepID=UPI00248FF40A|nr:uncharacterized protein LOC129953936 isoform X2 [Eupeodes corollae]
MPSLQELDIFELKPLITNLNCKLSKVSDYDSQKQLLCLVSEENEIVLRYIGNGEQEVLKLISWFRRMSRVIHDVSFDPSGTWLLVLCFDNTLHIIPALAVVGGKIPQVTYQTFSTTQVTSYIIPFVGPHECPNSKACPNHEAELNAKLPSISPPILTPEPPEGGEDPAKSIIGMNEDETTNQVEQNLDTFSHDIPLNMQASTTSGAAAVVASACLPNVPTEDATGNSQVMCTSFMCSATCPYPLSVVWWQTVNLGHRAIIGYSDGSICFVGLSPNCPFVASTAIESGSVVKMLICKDNNVESVTLLITSSLKQQYKLLLEQSDIQYVYPGDISPVSSNWQIITPIKNNSNCSDPASDNNSQQEEEVFTETKEAPTVSNATATSSSTTTATSTVATTTATTTTTVIPAASATNPTAINRNTQDLDEANNRNGILPAARARLASLKCLGSQKLNAIKMRLSDRRQKLEESRIRIKRGAYETSIAGFIVMDQPTLTPEVLSMSAGSFYTLQNLRHTYLLSALHTQTNTLSVHSMDISLKPVFLYKIPTNCHEILISSNILYSIQYVEKESSVADDSPSKDLSFEEIAETKDNKDEQSNEDVGKSSSNDMVNAVGVISSAMASVPNGDRDKFNDISLLGLFKFENETVLNMYQITTYANNEATTEPTVNKDDKPELIDRKQIRSPIEYVHFFKNVDSQDSYSLREMEIMKNEFPKICYDPCYVVTTKNVYYIQLKKEPFEIFLDAAVASKWDQCHEFCKTFDLSFEACIEFAGDYLLRKKKVAQALLTYNAARIKPIRTALKLAMFGQTYALMHLCAMALKSIYILRSQYFCSAIIKNIMEDVAFRHSEDVHPILPKKPSKGVNVNEGEPCSDYHYGVDESISNLQMSPSAQFHLANLLLITLAEKAVKDKNYIPLWNFLVTNTKFHTNMTSIVLCQSGLYSAALILAKARGACIDTFLALNSVVGQEFGNTMFHCGKYVKINESHLGWYSELNVCLYNLSEPIFMECITYLSHVALDYFNFLQDKLENIRECVLKRLEKQLNPFSAVFRPIVSHTSSARSNYQRKQEYNDNNSSLIFDYCKSLIETYLAVLIHMESLKSKQDNISNALSSFRLTYEDNQFAIESSKFKPLSAGFAHCACVVDGAAYFWGSNGVPCNFSVTKSSDPPEPPHAVKCLDVLSQLNLEVHAVVCGRQHSLVLTNNGVYAFGNNNYCQLGIGNDMQMALQPMLVRALDGKNISALEAGQYHNAVIADGFLYTWGWGVYGQLGHGSTENIPEPKLVPFFQYKKVIQVSLGHAHSLVLCKGLYGTTEVYVFGSNHFGQLGTGPIGSKNVSDSNAESLTKSLVPLKIDINGTAKIRLIHTKFFSNLVVDENNQLYTWGSSPQALRLANQIKRRANAKQKIEEFQRREITKRFKETLTFDEENVNVKYVATTSDVPSKSDNSSSNSSDDKPKAGSSDTKDIEIKVLNSAAAEANRDVDMDKDIDASTNQSSAAEGSTADMVDGFQSVENEMDVEPKVVVEEKSLPIEVDTSNEHMTPHLVDTTEVAGDIHNVSSGLFHFAMVTSSGSIYTWGKNLEHQLGTEDKERKALNRPAPLDNIDHPMYVECGADFTLVMSRDYVVKAFGGNANGQCGRDLGALFDKVKQRVICLPTTKRPMRYESQCIEIPTEINLPRPRIRLDYEPVRYLKTIPEYQPHFIQEAGISLEPYESAMKSPLTTNPCQESDDMISSIENLSHIDADSIILSCPAYPNNSSNDISADEQSYSRLPPSDDLSSESSHNSRELRNYIHYCLYVFHGLYNPDKIEKFSKKRLEYRIRTLMLNFKFVDAFTLCLSDCSSASKSLKIFEYFTKDTSFVPMRRQDLKFFIYRLFVHFITKKFDINECEEFFLSDLDYYLLELSYVLYFNNNNTELEQNLNQKFKNLITQDPNHNEEYRLDDTDSIFDSLSVKFKTIVCQSLLKYCDEG